jgi:ribosomal protein S18 acetylase RimI-like enzyme
MFVRVARVEDAPAMARVIVDTFLSTHRGQVPDEVLAKRRQEWTYEVSERAWARALRGIAEGNSPGECAYVAEDETGGVIGLATGGPADGEVLENAGAIYALFVREGHQRRGLGRRLVQTVATQLVLAGRTSLVVGCLAANAPARRFYEALGARVVGEYEIDEYGIVLPGVTYGWADARALQVAAGSE